MKRLFLIFSCVCAAVLFSCKKEKTCESCNDNNKSPIAKAGPDQVITLPTDSILLDGTDSSDPDGIISEWRWTRISGPASAIISNPLSAKTTVKGLTIGTYLFELMIKDDRGLFKKDTVQVDVDDRRGPNRPPVANAGPDQSITLPTNSALINGSSSSDPDNNISSYLWTKIAGPSSFTISNPNAIQTQVTGLVEGVYQFELKVTDARGLFSKDSMLVRVMISTPACSNCKIVFVSNRDGNNEIYSCNGDGTDINRLTNNAGTDDQPAWSPDGTRIAFISDRTGNPELYIMNADGSDLIQKSFSGSYSQNPTWSPDGTKIAYGTVSNGSMDIWVIAATNGSPTLLFSAPGYDDQPAWSPDGTRILLVSDWAAYDFVYDIYVINANGTGFTAITGNIFDHVDYLYPSWSPTGTKLACAISKTIGIDQYDTKVGVMNTNGSGLTAIISGAAAWTRTSWSGDGAKIAYTSLSGTRKDVSWVAADGSAWGTIVTNGWNADWKH